MAGVDVIGPLRDEKFLDNIEDLDEEDDSPAAPNEGPSGNEASDDSPPPAKQPKTTLPPVDDVNIDDPDGDRKEKGGPRGTSKDHGPDGGKRKHRRKKGKKWKPYYKLTWTEKRELEDRETKRANSVWERRFARGKPVAPYNTTQFLMEDHNVQEPDLQTIANGHRHHRESTSLESSDEFYSSPEDEEEFLQKEFSAVYESVHAERLNSMSKSELIQEYIQLEDRVDNLEQKLKLVEESRAASPPPPDDVVRESVVVVNSATSTTDDGDEWDKEKENLEKIRIFQEEIRILAEVNERLRIENLRLKEGKTDDVVAGPMEDEADDL